MTTTLKRQQFIAASKAFQYPTADEEWRENEERPFPYTHEARKALIAALKLSPENKVDFQVVSSALAYWLLSGGEHDPDFENEFATESVAGDLIYQLGMLIAASAIEHLAEDFFQDEDPDDPCTLSNPNQAFGSMLMSFEAAVRLHDRAAGCAHDGSARELTYCAETDSLLQQGNLLRNLYKAAHGIKPETMPSQSAPATCTLSGGAHAAD